MSALNTRVRRSSCESGLFSAITTAVREGSVPVEVKWPAMDVVLVATSSERTLSSEKWRRGGREGGVSLDMVEVVDEVVLGAAGIHCSQGGGTNLWPHLCQGGINRPFVG